MNKPTTILGIDPGTQATGYGVIRVKGNSTETLAFGSICPPSKQTAPEKYLTIFNGVDDLISQFQPDALAVETQFVLKNAQSAIKLGMARGVVILAAARRQIAVFEYAPAQAKRAVVGNGAASKSQIQKMVRLLLRLQGPIESEDAADALALALCHANHRGSYV
jgi:crossover junction endodeoxyribonuclease RuvC